MLLTEFAVIHYFFGPTYLLKMTCKKNVELGVNLVKNTTFSAPPPLTIRLIVSSGAMEPVSFALELKVPAVP